MSRLNVGNLFNENEDGAPVVSGISTFSSPHYFVPPSGTTAQRPQNPGEGMIRFNTDSGHLEYYTGTHWENIIVNNNDLGGGLNGIGTTASTQGTGHRGVIMGGGAPGATSDIDYLTISTFGNAQDFGNLSGNERGANNGIMASSTRGLMCGGDQPATNGNIETIVFASTGSSENSGTSFTARRLTAGCSNQTRAILAGGFDNPSGADNDIIECTTIASLGSTEDFGDLSLSRYFPMGCASQVRGIFMGGIDAGVDEVSTIDYVTIASTGDAQEFGDLVNEGKGMGSASNSTRGILAGGNINPGVNTNTIQFITIATTGNAQDFGDLITARRDGTAVASPTRMVVGTGYDGSSYYQALDSIEFLSTGNSVDFGDISNSAKFRPTGTSNGHGGL
jgi:hypothetical protein